MDVDVDSLPCPPGSPYHSHRPALSLGDDSPMPPRQHHRREHRRIIVGIVVLTATLEMTVQGGIIVGIVVLTATHGATC